MDSVEKQQAFFWQHWPAMLEAAEKSGAEGVQSFIAGFDDDLERRVLYLLSRQGFTGPEWQGKSFDVPIQVAEAGIQMALAEAKEAEEKADKKTKASRLNLVHMLGYNLAADLADCWPGDDQPREPQHFEHGLAAAEMCLECCEVLGLPPDMHAGDHWACGIHQLSLGRWSDAVTSFGRSAELNRESAKEQGQPSAPGGDAGFGINLAHGYLGLARWGGGEAGGEQVYQEALAAFESQLGDERLKGDAQFGLDQLKVVRKRHLGQTSP